VTGKIISVKKENNKNVYVEIRLERVVAICYDGDNLREIPQKCYMNFSQRSGVNLSFINSFEKFYENLWEYNIVGYIRKHDVNIHTIFLTYNIFRFMIRKFRT